MPIFRFSSIVIFSVESLVFFLEYNQTVMDWDWAWLSKDVWLLAP